MSGVGRTNPSLGKFCIRTVLIILLPQLGLSNGVLIYNQTLSHASWPNEFLDTPREPGGAGPHAESSKLSSNSVLPSAPLRRAGGVDPIDVSAAAAATAGRSAAELEQVVVAALALADDAGRTAPNADDLQTAAADILPSRDTRRLRFMELLAVCEAVAFAHDQRPPCDRAPQEAA